MLRAVDANRARSLDGTLAERQPRHGDNVSAHARCRFCGDVLRETGDRCWDDPAIRIGHCESCGCTQTMTAAHVTLDHYAADDYYPRDQLEAVRVRESHWNRKRVARIREYLPDAGSLRALDFGSGTGGFLRHADGLFAELTGFDLSAMLCEAHRADGYRCVAELDDVPGDIDAITLFHVLEHVPEPWMLLGQLRDRFPRAQAFVLETPNTDELLNSVFHSEPYARNHFSADHVWYFTPSSLRLVVERAGLEIVVDSQLQRYTLANNMGWLGEGRGGGQERHAFLNDPALDETYERVLIERRVADSDFFVCHPVEAT